MTLWVAPLAGLITAILGLGPAPAESQVVATTDLDYRLDAEYEDNRDLLDVYMPNRADRAPVIVFYHGGALRAGDKSQGKALADRFVPAGIGVVSANYRLSPRVMHPSHVQDAAAAFAWVVENIDRYGGDPSNVYVAGHSAGAYLAALLALDATHLAQHHLELSAIRGTIAISPFPYVEETARDRPKDVWGEDPAAWSNASVTPHIAAGKGPMLLIYADHDAEWRRRQNDSFAEAMRAAGSNEVAVIEVPDRDYLSLISKLNAEDDQIREAVHRFMHDRR